MIYKTNIDSKEFEFEIEGKKTNLYSLKNKHGVEVTFTNFGQRLVSLIVPDKNGNFDDIVLGFSSLKDYRTAIGNYFGATIGRYGNRISKGKFLIDGEEFVLPTNAGTNNLHGGNKGFHNVVWDVNQNSSNEIEFSRISIDMEEGYPGNLNVRVHYKLTDDNELRISYYATTDKDTIINLTNHSFFNLSGEGTKSINDHLLTINANQYTPINRNLIPTGEIVTVKRTPFDFTSEKPIGKDIEIRNQQLLYGNGYDHNFVLNDGPRNMDGYNYGAKVVDPKSGRTLEVYTDEPGIQFYSGNFLDSDTLGKSGKPYLFRSAFCLETQHFPNSPNQSNFPSTLLRPGEEYSSNCVYKFGIKNG